MRDYWHLWLGALFLKREAFEYQRERKDSFAHGLVFIALIGLVAGLAGLVGAALRFASGPNPVAVKNVVLTHLQAMPFYIQSIQSVPQVEDQFLAGYNWTWANFGGAFMGFPTSTTEWANVFAGVLVTPVFLVLGWLVFGYLVHVLAHRANPNIGLGHGLGTLALAASPQALVAIGILPGASVAGWVVSLWSLILGVFAIRTAYSFTTRRAIGTALILILIFLTILSILACLGLLLLSTQLPGGQR